MRAEWPVLFLVRSAALEFAHPQAATRECRCAQHAGNPAAQLATSSEGPVRVREQISRVTAAHTDWVAAMIAATVAVVTGRVAVLEGKRRCWVHCTGGMEDRRSNFSPERPNCGNAGRPVGEHDDTKCSSTAWPYLL